MNAPQPSGAGKYKIHDDNNNLSVIVSAVQEENIVCLRSAQADLLRRKSVFILVHPWFFYAGREYGKKIFFDVAGWSSQQYILPVVWMAEMKLDQEEQAILASVEAGEWRPVDDLESQKKMYREAAQATLWKDSSVNIRYCLFPEKSIALRAARMQKTAVQKPE